MRAAISVASGIEPTIILEGVDDSPVSIRRVIIQSAELRDASMLSNIMSSIAASLPSRLATVIGTLFRHPEQFPNARSLAGAALMSPTVMYETCARYSCPSPKALLMAARVTRAYGLLHGSKVAVEVVATRVGYHQSKIFERHTHVVLGTSPTSLRSDWSSDQIRERILLWLRSSHPIDHGHYEEAR
jgi:transcriptional regulator GlxA family with amidase domain